MNYLNWMSIGVCIGAVACGGAEILGEEEQAGDSHSPVGEHAAGSEHATGGEHAAGGAAVPQRNAGLAGADAENMSDKKYQALVKTVGQEKANYLRTFQRNFDVYQHDLPSGATVTWSELAPGQVGIVAIGQGEMPRLDIGKYRTASEVFTALAPNEQVPDELIELDARRLEMAPTYKLMAEAAARFPELQEVREASPEETDPVDVAGNAEEFVAAPLSPGFGQVGSAISGYDCVNSAGDCGAFPSADWYVTQKNRTAAAAIEKSDQEGVGGVQCSQSGQILARAWYDLGTFYEETQWYSFDLPTGWSIGDWFLQFDGGSTDFWFKMRIDGFQAGDVGSQCAYGYND